MSEDEESPKKATGLKKLKAWWSQITFVLSVAGALLAGHAWVDEKLDSIQQSTVDISDLKASNARIREGQEEINERITKNVNATREQIVREFQQRDQVDEELRANILAVLNELRARHGVVTLAEPPNGAGPPTSRRVSVREATREADNATIRSGNAMPQADPLAGLDGL